MNLNDMTSNEIGELAQSTRDEKIQEILSKDKDKYLRGCLASNFNITEKIQEILAIDEDDYVRSCLAMNPKITIKIQQILVEDKYAQVWLAKNTNLSWKIQLILASSKDKYTNKYLAQNFNIDSLTAFMLRNKQEDCLCDLLKQNPSVLLPKIVQIIAGSNDIIALSEDGSTWRLEKSSSNNYKYCWEKIAPIKF